MNPLSALQGEFQNYLLTLEGMEARVIGDSKADARTRLGIYADAYRLRLLEALQDNYPAVHTLLGDAEFDRLGRAYIDAYPSRHPSIRWFGGALAELLEQPPYAAQPVLAEMARFEWSLRGAFDAADTALAGMEDFATLDPEQWPQMGLRFHPSVTRLDLQWNVPALWKLIDNGEDPEAPQGADYPVPWLIWRRDLRQYFRSAPVDEGWALDAMLGGQSFGAVCEGLTEWIDPGNVAAHAACLLRNWVNDGMIVAVEAN